MKPNLYDKVDRALIRSLRESSGLRIREYVERTGIPRSTLHERLRRLAARGLRCTVLLDHARLGFPIGAFFIVPFTAGPADSPFVNTAQRLAPDLLLLECVFPSMKELEAFKDALRAPKCLLVIEALKREGFVPFD